MCWAKDVTAIPMEIYLRQKMFLFVFVQQKLETVKSLSALSRLLCRTLQLLDLLTVVISLLVTTGTLQLQSSLRFCRLAQSNRVSDMNA